MSRTATKDFRLLAAPRVARARSLAERYPPSREVLKFCEAVLDFQQSLPAVTSAARAPVEAGALPKAQDLDFDLLLSHRRALIALVSAQGTAILQSHARQMDDARMRKAVHDYFQRADTTSPRSFFARVLLQPPMATLRLAANHVSQPGEAADKQGTAHCPFCAHLPQAGCLRPLGHGLELSLVCSLCFHEWTFPRGRCPACNESKREKLAYYSPESELKHIQVLVCESCRRYLHLVNLSEEPRAVADVDELAALPLDVWAQEKGLQKLQPNLAGI